MFSPLPKPSLRETHCSWDSSSTGTQANYRTELIDFDVAHIGLPYNAILGYPALAKFMAVTHHAYNLVKLPGSDGTIVIPGMVSDALYAAQAAYKAATVASPADEDEEPLPRPPREEEAAVLPGEGRDKASVSGGKRLGG